MVATFSATLAIGLYRKLGAYVRHNAGLRRHSRERGHREHGAAKVLCLEETLLSRLLEKKKGEASMNDERKFVHKQTRHPRFGREIPDGIFFLSSYNQILHNETRFRNAVVEQQTLPNLFCWSALHCCISNKSEMCGSRPGQAKSNFHSVRSGRLLQ